jgi:glutathione S-transferase
MITVHHLENSRSQRILWLLEELGVDYEIVRYARDPKTMLAPPALRAVHPLGKSPVITDGESTIAESGAIIEHVLEVHGNGKLLPAAGTPERSRYRYWLHYAEGSLMPFLVMKLVLGQVKEKAPLLVRPVAKMIAEGVGDAYVDPNIERNLDFMESALENTTWFAGDELTGADIQMSYPVEEALSRGSARPRLQAFVDRVHARPAYKRALERS